MGGGEVLKEGYLIKSPPDKRKKWRKRWFRLRSSRILEYYQSPEGVLKGVVNLEDCMTVHMTLAHKKYKHVFAIETKSRMYFLVASSEDEMREWVEIITAMRGLVMAESADIVPKGAISGNASVISLPRPLSTQLSSDFGSALTVGTPNYSSRDQTMITPPTVLSTQSQSPKKGSVEPLPEAISTRRPPYAATASGDVTSQTQTKTQERERVLAQERERVLAQERERALAQERERVFAQGREKMLAQNREVLAQDELLTGSMAAHSGYDVPRMALESLGYSTPRCVQKMPINTLQAGISPPFQDTEAPQPFVSTRPDLSNSESHIYNVPRGASTLPNVSSKKGEAPAIRFDSVDWDPEPHDDSDLSDERYINVLCAQFGPPPVDRSSKPQPPKVDRNLKPRPFLIDSTPSDADLPRPSDRTVAYTLVTFNSSANQPAAISPQRGPSKPRPSNYTQVDIVATQALAAKVQRQASAPASAARPKVTQRGTSEQFDDDDDDDDDDDNSITNGIKAFSLKETNHFDS